MRTCIRCGCGCGRYVHASVVQRLECTLAMPQHSRPVNSRARSSVAVGQVVRGVVRTRAVVAVRGVAGLRQLRVGEYVVVVQQLECTLASPV